MDHTSTCSIDENAPFGQKDIFDRDGRVDFERAVAVVKVEGELVGRGLHRRHSAVKVRGPRLLEEEEDLPDGVEREHLGRPRRPSPQHVPDGVADVHARQALPAALVHRVAAASALPHGDVAAVGARREDPLGGAVVEAGDELGRRLVGAVAAVVAEHEVVIVLQVPDPNVHLAARDGQLAGGDPRDVVLLHP